jgi:hypothetical protein
MTDYRYVVVVIVFGYYLCNQCTKVGSSNPDHGEVYSIKQYVIKFVRNLRQVGGFLRSPPSIKLTATI